MREKIDHPPEDRPRLLVVEDEPVLRAALAAFFADQGFAVHCANSLAEARERLVTEQFRATILDAGLPDGSGLNLLATTTVERSIVISATPDEALYRAHGVRYHLAKPLDLRALEHVLGAALRVGRPPSAAGVRDPAIRV